MGRVRTGRLARPSGGYRPSGMEQFGVDTDDLDGIAIVAVQGELSIGHGARLATEIGDHVRRGRSRIVVDLGNVEFMDSTGLSFLLNGLRRVGRAGGVMVVVVPPDGHVRRVFEMTRLDQVFELATSRDEAQARLGLVGGTDVPYA